MVDRQYITRFLLVIETARVFTTTRCRLGTVVILHPTTFSVTQKTVIFIPLLEVTENMVAQYLLR